MAQYKVPQDVEADDKLIGPFSFRQFVYLLICAALIFLCIPLFNLFPLLIIIPIPVILFLLALSLPLKKDQPMETYLSAVYSYYTKPHNRIWEPGEPETLIVITAPKKTDEVHLKDLSQEEATHRLSFLADIVDTEGYAIKNGVTSGVREDVLAEANATKDIFEAPNAAFSQQSFQQTTSTRHEELVNQMRDAIAKNSAQTSQQTVITSHTAHKTNPEPISPVPPVVPLPPYPQAPATPVTTTPQPQPTTPSTGPTLESIQAELQTLAPAPVDNTANPLTDEAVSENDNIIKPDMPLPDNIVEQIEEEEKNLSTEYIPADIAERLKSNNDDNESEGAGRIDNSSQSTPSQDIIDLANNSDFSIETIAQQAKRINEKQDNEVYISLH